MAGCDFVKVVTLSHVPPFRCDVNYHVIMVHTADSTIQIQEITTWVIYMLTLKHKLWEPYNISCFNAFGRRLKTMEVFFNFHVTVHR
jgi:hypothetical protein